MDQFTMDEALSHRVGPDFSLADVDPTSTPGFEWDKEDWEREFHEHDDELDELQEMLFANGRSGVPGTGAVLLILQGMDTSGKGGVIRHVFRAFDPQALKIKAFGAPTAEERMHDFLWRVRPHEPAVGQIGVFDRSHYEDVLIQRVREMAPPEEIERRYDAIVDFEREMASRNVRIIKVMLHISKEFQKENLIERLENPDKHWKFEPGDLDERELWDEYQEAYEIAMKRTSTDFAP
ncbi:MAG TPA: PPK2 family polyphosphate--nucleotide phosphotransferase, partial [Corynebacterium pollutisoli]|nr:PPK2 family polyphosphate--nucleotide phosphotransferase [Corynebacterium pollutisoli]